MSAAAASESGRRNRAIDITGERFGRLVVIRRVDNDGDAARWLCKCDCGNVHTARGVVLRQGAVQSCGCLRGENYVRWKDRQNILGLSGQRVVSLVSGALLSRDDDAAAARSAALTLADHAADADELRGWLEACGLAALGAAPRQRTSREPQ